MADSVTDQNTLHSIAFQESDLDRTVNWTRISQVVERHARDLELRGSNPGPGSNFSLEFKMFKNLDYLEWHDEVAEGLNMGRESRMNVFGNYKAKRKW